MNEYHNIPIVIPNWPPLYQLNDQRWQRVWEIQLYDEQTVDADFTQIEEALSNDEIKVRLSKNGKTIYVEVTTIRWGLDDDLIVYSYKILVTIYERIGGIDTIQGQQKEIWIRSLRKKKT